MLRTSPVHGIKSPFKSLMISMDYRSYFYDCKNGVEDLVCNLSLGDFGFVDLALWNDLLMRRHWKEVGAFQVRSDDFVT